MKQSFLKAGAALAVMLTAAGCSPTVPTFNSNNSGPAPLMAAPTPQVSQNQLPPPPPPPPPPQGQDMAGDMNNQNANGDNTEVAALDPNAGSSTPASSSSSGGGAALSRNKVLGAYKVTTAGGNCQIILSLTKWSGGYRAASRGCPGTVADVSAWDVSGSNVVLRNSSGSQVASLSSSGESRYDGQTQGGQAISLYR
ncbi:protease inhibitor Inh/omp19 family protein [Fulvimarina sp. MAC3]|uniref:protease inhibitor Inh/omp19 family protein n=1 Tax=Fulvimarina sp. MAC3 TaxID=3148887 RepID=UPI0031FCFE2D